MAHQPGCKWLGPLDFSDVKVSSARCDRGKCVWKSGAPGPDGVSSDTLVCSMPIQRPARSSPSPLARKIAQFRTDSSGERNLYPFVRDLLVNPVFGIGLRSEQVVVDSALAGGRDIPDLTVFSTKGGRAIKTPDHAYGVFEVKRGRDVADNAAAIYAEKKKYIKAGTRWFFILDQEEVHKWDVMAKTEASVHRWEDLSDPEGFGLCFAELRPDHVALEEQLKDFRANKTPYAYQSIDELGKNHFTDTIREIAAILSAAVTQLVDTKVMPDLRASNTLIAGMEPRWGTPVYDWESVGFPIEFSKIVDEEIARTLPSSDIADYPEAHDNFVAEIEPHVYAVRIEKHLLSDYATRLGIEGEVSLLKPRRTNSKLSDSGKAVESFIYETASLIVSRMLMVRFSEDHGFLKRYISNGGVEVFARYADYYAKPMQALLKETYRQSSELYRNLFDPSILDWALDSSDESLSSALLHSMYLLSRWNFKTIHGDILSGVYDHYLEPSKRRALGEVFTRPEIARYMLEHCGYDSTKTVLDPACGTGTFLVEALNQDVRRLRSQGMLTEQTVTRTLRRLYGLDISPFSVSLAQIQLLWHNIDLFTGKSPAEIRTLAAQLVSAIQVQGGHSSLDTLGVPLVRGTDTSASQAGLDFATVASDMRRKRVASVPRRFKQMALGQYDIVIGNPPYVRPHRMMVSSGALEPYSEVAHGQVDLYVHFLYRAVRGWVKDGGHVSFIVPMGVLDGAYSGPLRRVLSEFKLTEIVDMEALRKKTFRGIKRPTIIFVLENRPGSEDDELAMTTLSMGCYDVDTDTIDFSKADRSTVKRSLISQSAYIPTGVAAPWMADAAEEDTSAILTKVSSEDAAVLGRMAQAPRLGSIVKVVYKRRGHREVGTAQANAVEEIPAGSSPLEWEPYVMLAYGIKLGSTRAIVDSGWPVYKGQNVFPEGPQGDPMGYWDAGRSVVDSLRLYAYRHLFDFSRLYAVREISQLPTACPVPPDTAFQNTVLMVQLAEDFPLNLYLMSRIPQWFAIKALRASIIEDLTTHWFKRSVLLLPIPASRNAEDVAALREAGGRVISRDKDLANAHRHVERLIEDSPKKTLFELFAENNPVVAGADLTGAVPGVLVTSLREQGDELVNDDLSFRITVPNTALRRYLAYMVDRLVDEGDDVTFGVGTLGALLVPANLEAVAEAINQMRSSDPARMFEYALMELDRVVARLFGMSDEDLNYITSAMISDGFLKQLKPNLEHRGLRIQPYADHSQEDRYA
ncbi:MAG TPA: N-6 DNA methylase [Bryobacteraceae bacterium]|nr:N-6 DNA methylase [Bryobacteraceae bacterium]